MFRNGGPILHAWGFTFAIFGFLYGGALAIDWYLAPCVIFQCFVGREVNGLGVVSRCLIMTRPWVFGSNTFSLFNLGLDGMAQAIFGNTSRFVGLYVVSTSCSTTVFGYQCNVFIGDVICWKFCVFRWVGVVLSFLGRSTFDAKWGFLGYKRDHGDITRHSWVPQYDNTMCDFNSGTFGVPCARGQVSHFSRRGHVIVGFLGNILP